MLPTGMLNSAAQAIATLVESIGVAIVAVGVSIAGFRYVAGLIRTARPFPPEGLRLALGSSLALSLEFLLGADILRSTRGIDPVAASKPFASRRCGARYGCGEHSRA